LDWHIGIRKMFEKTLNKVMHFFAWLVINSKNK